LDLGLLTGFGILTRQFSLPHPPRNAALHEATMADVDGPADFCFSQFDITLAST
jgi:hypothetical protein